MANVLQTIVEHKRVEVAEREAIMPLDSFKSGLTVSEKSLFKALSKPHSGYIFECKKASPSKGLIREPFDLDEILAAYIPYAAGISVLTDLKFFQGTYENLAYITARAPQPVLNKDFFVSPYQVYLARYYNADAILLMLSVLSDDEYRELADIATQLHLDVLTEVSNTEEMHRAIALEAAIIGINNRNLRDLSTDLATTEALVPLLETAHHNYVVISESGIYTHADVIRLSAVSNGFLVGSSLMAQQNLTLAVKELVYGQTKVCGITNSEDANSALTAGATHLGLIFAEKSPRCVTPALASEIVTAQPAQYIGVFVNAEIDTVAQLATNLGLYAVQLHGNESDEYQQNLRSKLPEQCEIWQAVGLSPEPTPEQLNQINTLLATDNCNRVLVDCKVGEQSGGTGQQFDWNVLNELPSLAKIVLAGGIGEHNIASAAALQPSIIDINSKVERAPGVKDAELLQRTLQAKRPKAIYAANPNSDSAISS